MNPESPYQTPATYDPVPVGMVPSNASLTLKQMLFSFNGRIPRRSCWLWSVVTMIAFFVPISLLAPLIGKGGNLEVISFVAMVPFVIVFIWISLAIRVKRWHDHNKSGTWVLIGMIPYVGGLISFVFLGCMRGTVGPNAYGDDPT